KMRNAFTSVRAAIDDDAIAGLLDPEFLGEIARNKQEFTKQCAIGFRRSGQTRNRFLWNNQDVHRSLRIHIMKSNRVVVFPDNLRRDFPGDYFLENGHDRSEPLPKRALQTLAGCRGQPLTNEADNFL